MHACGFDQNVFRFQFDGGLGCCVLVSTNLIDWAVLLFAACGHPGSEAMRADVTELDALTQQASAALSTYSAATTSSIFSGAA